MCIIIILCILECQTDISCCTTTKLIQEVACVPTTMLERPEFSVKSVLQRNDKLTCFYTGLPSYGCFAALVEYLQSKAAVLTPWNGRNTREVLEKEVLVLRPLAGLTTDQLFSVLIRLRRGLDALDVCVRFNISEATYSRLFTTWITFLSKELRLLFPFPTKKQVVEWMPSIFKQHFPNTRIIIDCYEVECQRPSGLMNS